ncbi:MAG: ABC transporter permease [Candidatus Hermodarchaeota archaeon]
MTSLRSFIIMRLILLIPMLWFLVTLVFLLLRVLPGDPIAAVSPQLPESQAQAIREQLGLDRPILEQYFDFFMRIFRWDFGDSIQSRESVGLELQRVYGPTIMLSVFAVLIGVPLGIVLGGYAGAKREKAQDHLVRLFTIAIYATPIFLLGILMQITFGIKTGIIPLLPPLGLLTPGATAHFTRYTEIWLIDTLLSGRPDLTLDILLHLILPCLCLGLLTASTIARQVRTHMIHQLEQDYVQFSRARGIPEPAIVYKDTLKNSAIPSIGVIGLLIAILLAGAVLTETTFNIPGLGRYLFDAIQYRDFPAVQGCVVLFAIVVGVISLFSDVLYAILDPRIRY